PPRRRSARSPAARNSTPKSAPTKIKFPKTATSTFVVARLVMHAPHMGSTGRARTRPSLTRRPLLSATLYDVRHPGQRRSPALLYHAPSQGRPCPHGAKGRDPLRQEHQAPIGRPPPYY